MEQTPKPTRRWFRFSLRTKLVLVTVACLGCGYLGWAMNRVRQRESFLKRPFLYTESRAYHHAPLGIRLVGANGYRVLKLWNATDQEIKEAGRLFPEAALLYEQVAE